MRNSMPDRAFIESVSIVKAVKCLSTLTREVVTPLNKMEYLLSVITRLKIFTFGISLRSFLLPTQGLLAVSSSN